MMTNCTGCVYNKGYCSLPRMLECPVKKLRDMDYEKKYKEALERARELYDRATDIGDIVGYDLESIFPELAESEDERIRRWLVELVENQEPKMFIEVKKMDVFAWLEKQKEQKEIPLMNGDAELYFDNWIQHNDTTKRGYFEEGIRYAQRLQKEQKPAEWSEEETKDLVHILKVLDDCYIYGKHDLSKTDHDNLTSTLKSLRPQYHGDVTMTEAYKMGLEAGKASSWKPSEEQMKALQNAVALTACDKELARLYNQLKKL